MFEDPFVVRLGNYTVDLLRRRVSASGDRQVVLTPGEFDLLVGLLERRGQPVPRLALLTSLNHGYARGDCDPRTVDTLMVRLRRKLGCRRGRQALIQTVYGKGYRLADERELQAAM